MVEWLRNTFWLESETTMFSGKHSTPIIIRTEEVIQPTTTKVPRCLLTFVHCCGAVVRVIRLRRHLRQGPVVTHRVKHSGENVVLHCHQTDSFVSLGQSCMQGAGRGSTDRTVVFAPLQRDFLSIFEDSCLEMKGRGGAE